jgi:hypothetical protein
MTTTLEAVQQTLAEYERLAIETGEWNGTDAPEFSNGPQAKSLGDVLAGSTTIEWTSAWLPSEAHPHPLLARARVYRKGVDRPIEAVVRWDEAVPADSDWRELWLRKPVALFGAFTKRAALRSGFRDVIGDRREPDEPLEVPTPSSAAVALPANPDRDWLAELANATTGDEIRELHAAAKAARAVTVELERAFRQRLQALADEIGDSLKPLTDFVLPLVKAAPKPRAVLLPPIAPRTPSPTPNRATRVVTPADIAHALDRAQQRTIERPKSGRRAQKPKPRG